jgi:hypothetical protein
MSYRWSASWQPSGVFVLTADLPLGTPADYIPSCGQTELHAAIRTEDQVRGDDFGLFTVRVRTPGCSTETYSRSIPEHRLHFLTRTRLRQPD